MKLPKPLAAAGLVATFFTSCSVEKGAPLSITPPKLNVNPAYQQAVSPAGVKKAVTVNFPLHVQDQVTFNGDHIIVDLSASHRDALSAAGHVPYGSLRVDLGSKDDWNVAPPEAGQPWKTLVVKRKPEKKATAKNVSTKLGDGWVGTKPTPISEKSSPPLMGFFGGVIEPVTLKNGQYCEEQPATVTGSAQALTLAR